MEKAARSRPKSMCHFPNCRIPYNTAFTAPYVTWLSVPYLRPCAPCGNLHYAYSTLKQHSNKSTIWFLHSNCLLVSLRCYLYPPRGFLSPQQGASPRVADGGTASRYGG